jgi:hypothetical protein
MPDAADILVLRAPNAPHIAGLIGRARGSSALYTIGGEAVLIRGLDVASAGERNASQVREARMNMRQKTRFVRTKIDKQQPNRI